MSRDFRHLLTKGFRAAKPPGMPARDRAGVSTKPWLGNRVTGIGVTHAPAGAMDFWKRSQARKRKRGRLA